MKKTANEQFIKYEHYNPTILKFVKNNGQKNTRILDVGCWTGSLGAQLISNISCVVDGLDNNQAALKQAQIRGYINTYLLQLDNLDVSIIREKYDLIIFGDVLEHAINPEEIIRKLKAKLKKGGKIIISLPNVGFVYYRLTHLLGRWDYKETGIMDRTHLKFYTLNSMRKFIDSQNLTIIDFEGQSIVRKSLMFINVLAKFAPSVFAIQAVFLLEINNIEK